jgi:hypothetical protein
VQINSEVSEPDVTQQSLVLSATTEKSVASRN